VIVRRRNSRPGKDRQERTEEWKQKRKNKTKNKTPTNPCYVPVYYVYFNIYVYVFKMNPNHLRKEKLISLLPVPELIN